MQLYLSEGKSLVYCSVVLRRVASRSHLLPGNSWAGLQPLTPTPIIKAGALKYEQLPAAVAAAAAAAAAADVYVNVQSSGLKYIHRPIGQES